MTYSSETKNDLKLGDNNVPTAAKSVLTFSPDFTAWLGAHCNNRHAEGQWSIVETTHHIMT